MSAGDLWQAKDDEAVIEAYRSIDDYTEEGQAVIRAEMVRRQLALPEPEPALPPAAAITENDTRHPFRRLWEGGYPLWEAYWLWNVGGSFVLLLFIFAMTPAPAGAPSAFRLLWALLLVLVALGYGVLVLVGVWRSASRYTGPRHWAVLAQAIVALAVARIAVNFVFSLFA